MKFSPSLGRIIPVLAPVILLILIAIHGVNVPFWDEWSMPGEFLALDRPAFKDFFAQSNESRLVIPKLIFLGVSKFAGWQPKHYFYLGWLIVMLIFLLLWRSCYARETRGRSQDGTSLACLTLSSALLFSPAAFENWLWGLQWVIFVPLLCALAAYAMQRRTRSFALRFCATVILNAVAMYSFSNGMLLWVASFPFWNEALSWFAGRRPSRAGIVRWALWSSAYALTALVAVRQYFADYHVVSVHPPLSFVLKEPWTVVKYFAAWCGGPFHGNTTMHVAIGLGLILAMLVLFFCAAKKLRVEPGGRSYLYIRKLYPSLLVIAYAFGSGAMTALGRAGFGVEQAYSSRYLFHSGALAVGFITALNTHRISALTRREVARNFSRIFQCVLILFSIFVFKSWRHGIRQFELMHTARMQTLLTVRMLGVAPKSPMVDKTCPWVDLPRLLKTLAERGIYNPQPFGDWLLDAVKHPDPTAGGVVQVLPRPQSEIGVMGWAIIPDRNVPADGVLLCKKGQSGNLEPYIMLAVGFSRKEVVEKTGKSSLRKSGFMEVFKWPEGDDFTSVEMFSVDETNRRLYPISRIP